MNEKWSRYRLVMIALIVLLVVIVRVVYPSLRSVHHTANNNGRSNSRFNRNIRHLILTNHARCRMGCRNITEGEIEEILHAGTINYDKSNLSDERGATFALEGYSHDRQHLRVIFAPKEDEMLVVTCIDLDKDWQCDCN